MHIPVLLNEVLEYLDPKSGEFIIDGTVGGGGHSAEILKRIGDKGILLGVDWDKNALPIAGEKIAEIISYPAKGEASQRRQLPIPNLILKQGNYADLPDILKKENLGKADGLIVDLGFSSDQLETGKGFSFLKDEFLDMRYDVEDKGQESGTRNLTAADVINSFNEKDLADIFYQYGEERFSRRIAKNILDERKKKKIFTTFDLVEIIKKSVPKSYERGRVHPATRVFQALRIYVNDELGNVEKLLNNLEEILNKGGRATIITFHSLEDRIVKNYFRQLSKEGRLKILTKKPVGPTKEEIKSNPRARSAKMRAAVLV